MLRYDCSPGYGLMCAEHFPGVWEADMMIRRMHVLELAGLKARLLAGESDEQVAQIYITTAKGVKAFHDHFYDVRPRLGSVNTIAAMALRGCLGLKANHHDSLLLLFGYGLGGRGVDGLLDYFGFLPNQQAARGTNVRFSEPGRRFWQTLVDKAVLALAESPRQLQHGPVGAVYRLVATFFARLCWPKLRDPTSGPDLTDAKLDSPWSGPDHGISMATASLREKGVTATMGPSGQEPPAPCAPIPAEEEEYFLTPEPTDYYDPPAFRRR